MKKKEEYCSIFMTTLMFVIPIGAIASLLIEIFGFVSIPKNKSAYDFIKDHGSLIAGLIALIAAWWTIQTQYKLREKNRFDDKKEYLAKEILRTKSIILNMDSLFNKFIQGNADILEFELIELSNQFEKIYMK